ncbi:MAG: hypothetical protein HYZ50_13055 [Deltaproteobacteria bacterium]|nr:hypothetical protein [Deltaproteobacteria bacterium]
MPTFQKQVSVGTVLLGIEVWPERPEPLAYMGRMLGGLRFSLHGQQALSRLLMRVWTEVMGDEGAMAAQEALGNEEDGEGKIMVRSIFLPTAHAGGHLEDPEALAATPVQVATEDEAVMGARSCFGSIRQTILML